MHITRIDNIVKILFYIFKKHLKEKIHILYLNYQII